MCTVSMALDSLVFRADAKVVPCLKLTKLSRIQPHSLDLLCLPEMILTGRPSLLYHAVPASISYPYYDCFTGYNFSGATAISPFLEKPYSGPTSTFCSQLAQQLHCYVTAGYPEKLETHEVGKRKDDKGNDVDIVGANSALLYGPDGQPIGNYRKTNLFETDRTWAKEGSCVSITYLIIYEVANVLHPDKVPASSRTSSLCH